MAADSSTLADEYLTSPHRNSNGTEHRLNIELADHSLSSEGPVETEEPASAVRTHGEERTPAMADNGDAAVRVPPATTPMSTDAAPTPPTHMSKLETEFRNLLVFSNLPVTKANLCRVALEDWQSSAELMGKRVEKRQKEIRSIRNEIYQVVGFYSAFQGLLLTAIAQSSLLHWNNRGYPLALSAFATGIAATGVVQKNMIIRDWKKTIASENPARKVPFVFLFLVQGPPWVVPLFWYGLDLRRYLPQKILKYFQNLKNIQLWDFWQLSKNWQFSWKNQRINRYR